MTYYVYLIKTEKKINKKFISYVGYTNNLKNRLKKHNLGKGAKFTRGKKWILVYYEKFDTKNLALKREIEIKKNRKMRNLLKNMREELIF
jgi:putative endonuclease